MAKITSVIAASHSPYLFEPVTWWNEMYAWRSQKGGYAEDNPIDDAQTNVEKHARVAAAYDELATVFQESKPDVVVVFGDDQEEQFDSRNQPALAVYVGGAYNGYRTIAYQGIGRRELKPKTDEHWTRVNSAPDLAKSLLQSLMDQGFDPAYMTSLPNEDFGMGHAFMRPLEKLTFGRFDIPVVPVLVNGLYPPQPSAARCVAAAHAIRKAIESWPEHLNVAVLGSGGLWHTPGAKEAYLDEEFDQEILARIESGDIDGLAAYFDAWAPPEHRRSLKCFESFNGDTGMRGGIGSGAGEVRNWIMAAAVADRPAIIVDYVPVYASPCGMGFAYWPMS